MSDAAVISGVAFEQQKRNAAEAQIKKLAQGEPASQLLSHLQRCLTEAIQARDNSGITAKLLEAQRRRKGEYSPERLAQLQKYKLPVYWVPLTQTKCIHTEAWLRDLLMPYANKIWTLEPTVLPEVQADEQERIHYAVIEEALAVMAGGEMVTDEQMRKVVDKATDEYKRMIVEEAKDRAKAMESLIQDQHEECGFSAIFRDFQSNLTTYGTAFLKGPFTVVKKMPKWVGTKRVVGDRVIPACSAPSPHDIYPAPWNTNENDGHLFERIKTYREALSSVRNLPNYQTKQIEQLLSGEQSTTTVQTGDNERAANENKSTAPIDNRIECWQFTGPLPGYMLIDWGLKDCVAANDYNVEVVFSSNYILKVVPMWDETGVRSYFRGVFKSVPGSFWGVGVPILMSASQDRANMIMTSMIDNTNWASGPIGWVDVTRVVNQNDLKEWHPRKLVPVQSTPAQTGAPMGFMSIELKVAELNLQYQSCLADADNESGVPAYMYGSGSSGPAAGTATGLHTLMNAAARGIKDALLSVDEVMTRFVAHWADWNDEYSNDESVKGDIRVVCSGATGLFVQELQLSKADDLFAQAMSLVPLTGPAFVLNILKEKAKILGIDTTMLPNENDVKAVGVNVPPQTTSGNGSLPGTTGAQPGATPKSPAQVQVAGTT